MTGRGQIVFFAWAACAVRAGALFAGAELDLARQALRDGLWKIALVHADAARQDPADRDAGRLAALEALDALGEHQQVLDRLASWPDASGEAFRYRKAQALARLGRRDAAREALAAPFASPDWNLAANRLKARIAAASGRRDEAWAAFESAVAAADSITNLSARAEIASEWARFVLAPGAEQKALDVLKRGNALAASGRAGDEARLLASELYAAVGKPEDARALWKTLADSAEDLDVKRRAGFRLGFAEFASAATRTSGVARIRALVRARPDDPDAREAAIRLADDLLAVGDAAGAYDEYRRFLEANPASALDAHLTENRGWALMALGRRAEAIGAFARAAQVATNAETRLRCLYKQADALVADGRPADAAPLYAQVAAAGNPLASLAAFAEADALERAGKTPESTARYRAVWKSGGPKRFPAALRLAAQVAAAGRCEDAIALYTAVVTNAAASAAERVAAHAGRGRAHYRAYRFREARADFAEVAAREPKRADEMRFLKALCLYGEGGDADAKAEALDLLGRTNDAALRADVSLWLAKWCYNHREWRAAQTHYEAYAARHAQDEKGADALTWAARCASARGDDAQAVELTTRAAKAAPKAAFMAEILLVQGEALMELARFAEAVIVFDRVKTTAPSDDASRRAAIRRADALYALGADNPARYADALKAYRDLEKEASLAPGERIAAAYRSGRILEKLNRRDEAEDQFYAHVVVAWRDARAKGAVFDENACRCFAQAAFILSEAYAARGDAFAAAAVLRLVVESGTASAKEASRRLEQFERKGFVR